jgi:hypothetical protein
MGRIQIDVANLRAVLNDDHDFVRGLVEVERLDQRIGDEPRHPDRPAAFAGPKRNLARQHRVIRLLHRRDGPGLQDRIGKIGNPIGRFRAEVVGHIGMGPVEGDGARPAGRRREQIVHAERVVEHPASLVGGCEIRNHLALNRFRGHGSARRCTQDARHQAHRAEFEHHHLLPGIGLAPTARSQGRRLRTGMAALGTA